MYVVIQFFWVVCPMTIMSISKGPTVLLGNSSEVPGSFPSHIMFKKVEATKSKPKLVEYALFLSIFSLGFLLNVILRY